MSDSDAMRFRLARLIGKERYHPAPSSLRNLVEEEIGIQFASPTYGGWESWEEYFRRIPAPKVLDTITVAYKGMRAVRRQGDFISQVNRIFREENLAYEVDEAGGVHALIDGAFAANKQSVILGLVGTRYAQCLARVKEVDAALMASPPNYTQAIRSVFGANENLFKLMFDVPRLDRRTAEKRLGARLQSNYEGHRTMQSSSAQILASFTGWIEAAHYYRHEAGQEAPSQPAAELAIVLISEGMSFVRWLAAIDKAQQP